MTWQPLNLSSSVYAVDPEPPHPDFNSLLYTGKRHVFSAPTESLKTLVATAILLDARRAGRKVAAIDFEMGPHLMRRLLVDLGATDHELADIYYVEPDGPPSTVDIENIVLHRTDLVVIDASMGAFHASGLDDNKRQDVEKFAGQWITPLWQARIATLVLDHVTKASEGRGKYAIGSERKVGQVDVHLGLEVVGTTLTRGGTGLVKVKTLKDRPGFLTRPYAAEISLASDPDTHRITWDIRPAADQAPTGEWRPTVLMEKVSRYLERHPDGANRTTIYAAVEGKRDYLIVSVDSLLTDGYAEETVPGKKGTAIRVLKPYRDEPSPPSPIVPDRPRDDASPSSPPSPRLQAGTETGTETNGDLDPGYIDYLETLEHEMTEAGEFG
jgi:hypothetical protein